MPEKQTLTRTLGAASLGDFIRHLAAPEPCPGGGSVSAYAGALGGALVAMVASLTRDKAGFEEATQTMEILHEQGLALAQGLAQDVDRDAAAYQAVVGAYALSRQTEAEQAVRKHAIQAALQQATEVPLEVASDCLAAAELALTALSRGNPNAASDAAVAGLMALAGCEGALLNVAINLGHIKDQSWAQARQADWQALGDRACRMRAELWQAMATPIPLVTQLEQSR